MIDLVSVVGTRLPRLVAPLYREVLWRRPADERIAYLTFDDGPTTAMTRRLLDLLARFDAPSTFFLIGAAAERDPDLVRAVHAAGHTLGNHTFTHPDAWRTEAALVVAELARTTSVLEDMVQAPIRWMRPPYGRFTAAMRAWCRQNRQRLTMWDVGPGDYLPDATPAVIERRIRRHLRPGSIVVLHDNPKARDVTPAVLERLLPALRGEGWRFAAL
jgi:peptidoglycan/xylan/chitin deacetylase (PgdA/CDA1 family)